MSSLPFCSRWTRSNRSLISSSLDESHTTGRHWPPRCVTWNLRFLDQKSVVCRLIIHSGWLSGHCYTIAKVSRVQTFPHPSLCYFILVLRIVILMVTTLFKPKPCQFQTSAAVCFRVFSCRPVMYTVAPASDN